VKYPQIDDTIYFPFASNDTSGSGSDGASATFVVRECGAAAGAAPTYSGNATLLSHASFPAGCWEIAVAVTAANGFAADKVYSVYCTLAVDSQNPTGFVGDFQTRPVDAVTPGTLNTLDDLNASLSSDHGAGSWATATGFSTFNAATDPVLLTEAQPIDDAQVDGTVGAALLGMEAQAVGRWTIVGTTLTLYRRDGVTVVRTFTLANAPGDDSRT
jgi:hypothetical protein